MGRCGLQNSVPSRAPQTLLLNSIQIETQESIGTGEGTRSEWAGNSGDQTRLGHNCYVSMLFDSVWQDYQANHSIMIRDRTDLPVFDPGGEVPVNLPLTLYEYLGLLLPGFIVVFSLANLPFWNQAFAGLTATPQLIAQVVAAYLLGSVCQTVGRGLITWLRWRTPWLRNPKRELLRRSKAYDDPVTAFRTWVAHSAWWQHLWKRPFLVRLNEFRVGGWSTAQWVYRWLVDWPLRFLFMVILPWPEEPMFPPEKIAEIKRGANELAGGRIVPDGEVFTVCMGAIEEHKAYDTFSLQADLFRGVLVAVFVLGVTMLGKGDQYSRAWFWGLLYVDLLFLQRYQHFEYLAAKSVYEQFLGTSAARSTKAGGVR